jgi:hypothetical protein
MGIWIRNPDTVRYINEKCPRKADAIKLNPLAQKRSKAKSEQAKERQEEVKEDKITECEKIRIKTIFKRNHTANLGHFNKTQNRPSN